jgi:hypothetical protein
MRKNLQSIYITKIKYIANNVLYKKSILLNENKKSKDRFVLQI